MKKRMLFLLAVVALCVVGSYAVWAQDARMTFFVTSVGLGNGADLGGLTGADQALSDVGRSCRGRWSNMAGLPQH